MNKKTKKKVFIGAGLVGASLIGYGIAKALEFKFSGMFSGFKRLLPKGIINTYALNIHPKFPIKNQHVIAY